MSDNFFDNFSINFGVPNAKVENEQAASSISEDRQADVSPADNSVSVPGSDSGTDTQVSIPELTDADFERLFGELAAQAKQDEDTIAAAASVIEAEYILTQVEEGYKVAKAEIAEIDDEVTKIERELTRLKRIQAEKKSVVWDFNVKHRTVIREVSEKKAAANTALDAIKQQQEMDVLSDRLLEIAQKFEWFKGISVETNEGVQIRKAMQHQWDAIRFMVAGKRIILGDEMGLGKTLSAIGAMDVAESKRILIIAPADISGNFLEEINFWAGHRAVINIRGESKADRKVMLDTIGRLDSFIVVVNYEAWRRDKKLLIQMANLGFDTMICDEAHTIKETDTAAYLGVQQMAHAVNVCPKDGAICQPTNDTVVEAGRKCPKCGWQGQSVLHDDDNRPWSEVYWDTRSIKNIYLMTGTPILNKPSDLFALLSIVDPVTFGNKAQFERTYAEWDYNLGKYTFGPGGMSKLIRRLSGKFLARKMQDAGIVLPPQKPILHSLTLDPTQYPGQCAVIAQINEHAAIILDDDRQMSITAQIALITRLRQANVWPGGITLKDGTGEVVWRVAEEIQESLKMDKAVSLIKEFAGRGERVVVFSQFSTALRELDKRINLGTNDEGGPMSSVVFDGSTPPDLRIEIRRNFDRSRGEMKKWDVVMANYKTGGSGLNLTAATHTIILDREWNPGKENQSLARTNRIGQTEANFVHIIEIADTIDEWMNEIINNKAAMISGFNEGADTLRDALVKKLRGHKK